MSCQDIAGLPVFAEMPAVLFDQLRIFTSFDSIHLRPFTYRLREQAKDQIEK